MTSRNARETSAATPKSAPPAITIRSLDTPEAQDRAAYDLLEVMGWRAVEVAGEEFLIPVDETHPDHAKCARKIARAQAKAGVTL